jgi:hypothetical protein
MGNANTRILALQQGGNPQFMALQQDVAPGYGTGDVADLECPVAWPRPALSLPQLDKGLTSAVGVTDL